MCVCVLVARMRCSDHWPLQILIRAIGREGCGLGPVRQVCAPCVVSQPLLREMRVLRAHAHVRARFARSYLCTSAPLRVRTSAPVRRGPPPLCSRDGRRYEETAETAVFAQTARRGCGRGVWHVLRQAEQLAVLRSWLQVRPFSAPLHCPARQQAPRCCASALSNPPPPTPLTPYPLPRLQRGRRVAFCMTLLRLHSV